MKQYYTYLLLSLLGLCSCQYEDTEELMMLPEADLPMANAVITGGQSFQGAGYGYEPLLGQSYDRALVNDNTYQVTVNRGLQATLEIITDQQKLDAFVSRGRSFGVTIGLADQYQQAFEQFGGGPGVEANIKKKIVDRIVTADSVVTAVARITSRHYRYETVDIPSLTSEARVLLDQGDASAFFDKYGTTYVSSHVRGGEAYYVYNFAFSRTNRLSRSEQESRVAAYLGSLFDTKSETSISDESTSDLGTSVVSASAVSTIEAYEPAPVGTVVDLNNEITRLQDYITEHPDEAATVEMSLRTYASFLENEGLEAELDRRLACFGDYYQWQQLSDQLTYINQVTTISRLKSETAQALEEVKGQISQAVSCRTSSGSPATYQGLLDWWELEQRTVPLYRYYSAERTNHYYSPDPTSVTNIDGAGSYQLQGIECRIFKQPPGGGMTWIKEWWYNAGDNHAYSTEIEGVGLETDPVYQYQRELGYIYKDNGSLDEHLIRPLRLYYNNEVKDHMMTTDPQAEAFGSPEGGNGYRFNGTLGFAVSQE